MSKTGNRTVWTVYTAETDGDSAVVYSTIWRSDGPVPDTRRVMGRYETPELAQEARTNMQGSYDRLRRAMSEARESITDE